MATVSCGTTSERFGFIERYRELGVTFLCQWLDVSRSGFYASVNRAESKHATEDKKLLKQITQIYWRSQGRYGSPRVFNALKRKGINVGKKRVERLMREAGLKGRIVRVTHRKPGLKRFRAKGDNLLRKQEAPTAINQVWVADVTYLKVDNRWQYLATVMDLYSRRIIGWSISPRRTAELTCATLRYSLKKRNFPTGVLFHTDRGVEYTGIAFQTLLNKWKFKHSVNRPGHCTDNAFMESFFHSMKAELIRGRVFDFSSEIQQALSNYINKFYNSVRLHSGLNYMSPIEYEEREA